MITDIKRDSAEGTDRNLFANLADAETTTNEVILDSTGFTNNVDQGCIYVAIAAPPDTRSQTAEEFAESQARFVTYNNRAEIEIGKEAEAKREEVINEAENLGIDTAEIKKLLGK